MIVAIVLGTEYDDALREEVCAVLDEMSARRVNYTWGLGGSQWIDTWTFALGDAEVVFEAETYMGLLISGEETTVLDFVRRLESRGWVRPVS
jgi:hypothetical protein